MLEKDYKELLEKIDAQSSLPKGFDPVKGFKTFDDFKDAFGAAGNGQAWHHIVEQTVNSGKFAPELLQNPANVLTKVAAWERLDPREDFRIL